jgi:hypothetical protein
MFCQSTRICHSSGEIYQAINLTNVDFHEPDSHTRAVFFHPSMFRENLSKTLELPSYENDISSIFMFHFLYLNIISEYLFFILGISSKVSQSLCTAVNSLVNSLYKIIELSSTFWKSVAEAKSQTNKDKSPQYFTIVHQ